MVRVYFNVLEGNALLQEHEEDALHEGTELGVSVARGPSDEETETHPSGIEL